jgi:4-hydroxy-3-polyprenylbenzoate decarboxylase
MIHDRRSIGILLLPWQHIGVHYQKYEERNEPMPFAIAIAPDPLSLLCGYIAIPHQVDEMSVAGGLRKKPLEVVKCESNDLLVPAGTEIVVEGIVPPGLRASEGPFGEYTGYRASPRDERPIGVIKAVTWRNDPIFYFCNPGLPVGEQDTTWCVAGAAIVKEALQKLGIPVQEVNLPPEANCQLVVVTTKTPMMRMAHRIASGVFGIPAIAGYAYKLMVCNDDIDPFNISQVFHALISKCHPDRGQFTYYHPNSSLCPYGDLTERFKLTAPQGVYDCTWPVDWPIYEAVPPKSSFTTLFPAEVQENVIKKWSSYGFK